MMALVPSTANNSNSNANKEKIRDEFRPIKKFLIKQESDNQSDVGNVRSTTFRNGRQEEPVPLATRPVNHFNTDNMRRRNDNEITFEQVYQFDQYRDGIPMTIESKKPTENMPLLSIAASFNNRNRQLIHDNMTIQLPLIETNQARPISQYSQSKKPNEPLSTLPAKRRRNPNNNLTLIHSDDSKQSLLSLTEYASTSQNTRVSCDPPPIKSCSSPMKIRTSGKESNTPVLYSELSSASFLSPSQSIQYDTSTLDSSRVPDSRLRRAILSRPFPTPELMSDTRIVFRLVIQDGVTKDQTDDFLKYRQLHYSIWGYIVKIFRLLETLMYNYAVPVALVDGEKVAELAQIIEIQGQPTREELLNTIINREEVEKLLKQPGRRFHGKAGKERAAIIIQSYWRGFYTRCTYKAFKRRQWASRKIALFWLRHSTLSKSRKQLKLNRRRQFDFFKRKQDELRENWSHISSNRRIIVHIPSLGITECIRKNLSNVPLKENYQIGRLCEIDDPNVDVIYISPMPINDEILQYYNKLINLRALVEHGSEQQNPAISNNVTERFIIIVPEALHRFPDHSMCLSTLLKYSPKALQQIKTLITDRLAYLVTGVSHIDDLHIAEYLEIPIYGCEPEISYLYSTKSGSKRIFKSSNVPMPYGEYDIYNQNHLLESLCKLILEHVDVQRWIFKIDDNINGLGIAYCDIATHLPCYEEIFTEATKLGTKWFNEFVQKNYQEKVLSELPSVLSKHTVYINKTQYNSWSEYLKAFLSEGGVIEAYPPAKSLKTTKVCLLIEPNGHHSLIFSGDEIYAESQFSCWGLSLPQSSVDATQLNTYCSSIVEQCKQRNIYGYIDIDFITFMDKRTNQQILWVIDLFIGYSEHVALYRVMKYTTMGEFNAKKHSYNIKTKQLKQRLRNWQNGAPEYTITEKSRHIVWSSKLYHKNLANLHYSVFFQLCRTHGVGFDIREKQGSIFTLVECDHHENLGMITISDTLQTTLSNFARYLNTIYQQITESDAPDQSNFMVAVNHIEQILGLTQEPATSTS